MAKCSVCGRDTNLIISTCSCNKNTYNYCATCYGAGYEPYNDLVNYGFTYNMFSKTYRDKILFPSLQHYGKTIQQFNLDVTANRNKKETIKEVF